MTSTRFEQQDYANEHFSGLTMAGGLFNALEFYGCSFDGCDFSRTAWHGCKFDQCEFNECDLSGITVQGTRLLGVVFIACKMIDVDWTLASWPRVAISEPLNFQRCLLHDSTFMGLDMSGMVIGRCKAVDVNFSEADLTGADFSYSDLTSALFRNTTLAEANFIGAENYRIDIFKNDIRRAKFELPEAMSLLDSLDIELQ